MMANISNQVDSPKHTLAAARHTLLSYSRQRIESHVTFPALFNVRKNVAIVGFVEYDLITGCYFFLFFKNYYVHFLQGRGIGRRRNTTF
jgi:hypothetical protein